MKVNDIVSVQSGIPQLIGRVGTIKGVGLSGMFPGYNWWIVSFLEPISPDKSTACLIPENFLREE